MFKASRQPTLAVNKDVVTTASIRLDANLLLGHQTTTIVNSTKTEPHVKVVRRILSQAGELLDFSCQKVHMAPIAFAMGAN